MRMRLLVVHSFNFNHGMTEVSKLNGETNVNHLACIRFYQTTQW
jgi:hypothetical protein